ncbi:MAG TPA: cohesin domain-containing protein [Candidatus Xenobia bacterium]|nr:cohesin domain-containing protein [Candidatus Xenobia bacterium]
MKNRLTSLVGIAFLALVSLACPKGGSEFDKGKEAELRKDYDTALIQYERALQSDPGNPIYQARAQRMRFYAAQMHVDRGHKLRDQGLLEPAAAEFEKALAIDPSSFVAEQELRRTLEMIVAQRQAQAQAGQKEEEQRTGPPLVAFDQVPEGPIQLRPLSRAPLDLRMTEDAKRIFESIGKLAGINVIFDPEFQPRRITVELDRATLEQALDVASLMTKSFWKAVTPNTIMVIPDNAAKRRAYEEQIIKTFYLSNTMQAAELNEAVQLIRAILDVKRISPSTANNAIIIRDTPDKVAVAEKIIRDIDQARPEVQIQVTILGARRDRLRDLGIVPSSTVPLIFTPRSSVQPENAPGTGTSTTDAITVGNLGRLSSQDYSLVLPSATAMALLTDSTTKVLQSPEIRATDMQTAKLRIGDKVPYATGSFSAASVGGVGVNPLVNTQFQYQDVGVNVDVTPRVHSNREVSMKVKVEVSNVSGRVNIGGFEQPIFGQRIVEHDVRLREGETSILGGIIDTSTRVSIEGWPGLAQIPILRWLFSSETKELQETEVLIALTPRIIRLPEIGAMNVRPLAVGTDEQVYLPRTGEATPETTPEEPPKQEEKPPTTTTPGVVPPAQPQQQPPTPRPPAPQAQTQPQAPGPAPAATSVAAATPLRIAFQPAQSRLKVGAQAAVEVTLSNAKDVFSVPFQFSFDPKVVELVEVHHGGFMAGDQPATLVHRVDKEAGTAIVSISRPPGTGGVSGSGIMVTLLFRGVAAGRSPIQIQNVLARDAKQQPLNVEASVAELVVE